VTQASLDVSSSRRRLALDGLGIAASAVGFGLVFGLTARSAGFTTLDATLMSVVVFAGAAEFAAVGYVATGLPLPAIMLLTGFLNARHLLYSASLAPRLQPRPIVERLAAAHVLTDEAFALAAAHFARVGRVDMPGYWIGAIGAVFVPWNVATVVGVVLGGAIPDPARFGLDVVFPAAMLGLAVGLVTNRRELVAAACSVVVAVALAVAVAPSVGIIVGALVGPAVGLAIPGPPALETALDPAPMGHVGREDPLGEPDGSDRG